MLQGSPGELLVKGPNVMQGYWSNAAATAAVFTADWYHTGDIAQCDQDGFVTLIDRARDLIVSGGLNVYPSEVENALTQHPMIREAAVIGVPDDRWGESVKAFVVLQPNGRLSESEVVEHTRSLIGSYKKPKSVEFVNALPEGSTGKVLKRALREPYWDHSDRQIN
jgi:acyl-CoA synthetase (AMP-forming)/AMP-acid ligase II